MAYLVIYIDGRIASRARLDGPTLIGRSTECHLALPDPSVSRMHCVIGPREGGWVVTDMDSHNGTAVAGLRVSTLGLADGDELTIGGITLRFYEGNPINRRPVWPEQALAPHHNTVDPNAETVLLAAPGERVAPFPQPRPWEEIHKERLAKRTQRLATTFSKAPLPEGMSAL